MNYYENCRICPRNCGINRRLSTGVCGCSDRIKAARAGLHYYEEPFLSGTNGSGTVFFSGCSLGCVYCQNGQISRNNVGIEISTDRLADIFLELEQQKAHNINLVTGTHFIPSIAAALAAAKDKGLKIPVLWNSSGYEKPEYLQMLEGLVDIFMPDFKTMSAVLGTRYMKAADYPERAKESLDCMVKMAGKPVFEELPEKTAGEYGTNESGPTAAGSVYEGENVLMKKGVVVRHLVIPGQTEDSKNVIRYLYETYGDDIWVSIMSQYTPVGRFGTGPDADSALKKRYPELAIRLDPREYEEVIDHAIELGIEKCMIQEGNVASDSFIPEFDGTGVTQ